MEGLTIVQNRRSCSADTLTQEMNTSRHRSAYAGLSFPFYFMYNLVMVPFLEEKSENLSSLGSNYVLSTDE